MTSMTADDIRRELLTFLLDDTVVWEMEGDDRRMADNNVYRQGVVEFASHLVEKLEERPDEES